ncbi:outer membrane lipoprotein-sorting protein [Granulicella sp. dw_53]|uniref:outer membrane lipoprotein-sorting protein n=1 Tax=Granulicella sp. dw_53 TaxID=2719792 RepID=UPI0021081CB8|nr:outer membrane lipoprotein-sorting protein [Granulicella sp. dw_53]
MKNPNTATVIPTSLLSATLVILLVLSAASAPTFAATANSPTEAVDSSSDDPAGFGPLDPTPPANLTPDQIIQKFAARESVFNQARQNYVFRQSVKVQTLAEDTNRPDGEYQQVTDITFNRDGKREERVVFAPQNSLERVMMSPGDFDEIEHRLPFVLTTEDLPQYDVAYLGRQKVDELDTYVFSAGPKTLVKGKRYFQGKVWVDQQDFQIVLVNGKTVPQDMRKGHEDLSPPFTTYYEQIDGQFWFPTYTKAEGNLHFAAQQGAMAQDVHIRTIVKYSDYKRFRATSKIIYNGEDITNNKATPDNNIPATPTNSSDPTPTADPQKPPPPRTPQPK